MLARFYHDRVLARFHSNRNRNRMRRVEEVLLEAAVRMAEEAPGVVGDVAVAHHKEVVDHREEADAASKVVRMQEEEANAKEGDAGVELGPSHLQMPQVRPIRLAPSWELVAEAVAPILKA